ncbi:MAG: nucleoside-triphosphatase [Spirochaetaceae bacterium]
MCIGTSATAKRIVITGPRGSGKTTRAAELVTEYRGAGQQVAGVLSLHDHPDDPRLEAYRLLLLSTGETHVLARRSQRPTPPSTRFSFSETAFEAARRELSAAAADLLLVDECGPLELQGGGLWHSVEPVWAAFPGDVAVVIRERLLDALVAALEAARRSGPPYEIIRIAPRESPRPHPW